jgi:hypothetical protein
MTTGLSVDSFDPEQHCNWKNEDESDITRDVDVLVWWRDVGQDRFPRTSGDNTSLPGYSCGQMQHIDAERIYDIAYHISSSPYYSEDIQTD